MMSYEITIFLTNDDGWQGMGRINRILRDDQYADPAARTAAEQDAQSELNTALAVYGPRVQGVKQQWESFP